MEAREGRWEVVLIVMIVRGDGEREEGDKTSYFSLHSTSLVQCIATLLLNKVPRFTWPCLAGRVVVEVIEPILRQIKEVKVEGLT